MPPRKKVNSNKASFSEEIESNESQKTKPAPKSRSKAKREAERSPETVAKELNAVRPTEKKIKQLSFFAPSFQDPTQRSNTSIEVETFNQRFQNNNHFPNYHHPNPSFNMRPNFSFGRNPQALEEEYRLIEELISTENRYHAIKFKQIIADLKSKDELKILEAITLLSTELSMAQEENFGALQLDFLVPEVINCLNMESPEIMMHAAVSLTHILDIMPAASKILVNCGGVDVLCQKMQNFEFIDVAESAIKALEKVSFDYGLTILNSGGMEIMLTMIDFLVSSTQKAIISIISNIFRLVNSEQMLKEKILPILPVVLSYTQNDPSRQEVMFSMVSRLSDRIVRVCGEDFEKKREYLEVVAENNMVGTFCLTLDELVENFDLAKVEQIETILKTLNKFCYFSLKLCVDIFNSGLINIIEKIMNILDSSLGKENQLAMLAYETISLVNSILALRTTPHPLVASIAAYIGIKITENSNVDGRIQMFKEHPEILQTILERIGVRLPSIYENNTGSLFKYLVLISFEKMIEFSDPEHLRSVLNLQQIANFISKLTTFNDIMVISVTLIVTELLIAKLPEAYVILTREGVIDYIKSLSSMTEAGKLEAYNIVPKKYNPLETLKQFTTSINRLAGSNATPNEFLANLEAESHRLESIMQQLQTLKNPAATEGFSDLSASGESKPLSSFEEGTSPAKTSFAKNLIQSLQNLPKPGSHSMAAGLNVSKKQIPDEFPMEEEVPSEKANVQVPVDKLTELKREVSTLAGTIYNNIKEEVQKKNFPQFVPSSIINKLEEISLSLEQNQWNPAEFGQKHFQKYLDIINEHGGITNYELKSSRLLTHLLNFLFDNVLAEKAAPSILAGSPTITAAKEKESGGSALKKFKFRVKEEEKKTNTVIDEEKQPKEVEKPVIDLTDQQCRTILGRIVSFLYYFKKVKNRSNEEIYLQDFLRNLQEMLTNSDMFSLNTSRNLQEYEASLSSDLRFLAQRIKFKAQYCPESKTDRKKAFTLPSLQKGKSVQIDEDKKMFPTSLETQNELYSYKDSVFKDVPLLALSVEQFGTLEVIEDYLLNKLNSKEDLAGGLFGRNFNDFIGEKYEANPEQGSDDQESEPNDNSIDDPNVPKNTGINKVPVTNPKSKSPGAFSLQKSHSTIKTKHESKFVKNEKRRWVDRLTGKEVNFKKYLELKFFINDEEVDKCKSIYEIFSKNRNKLNPNGGVRFGGVEDIVIEYKLVPKKVDGFEFTSSGKDQYKQMNLLCLDHKSILQNMISEIASLDLKTSDSSAKEIIQMMAFIHQLVDFDKRVLSPATMFNASLIDLKANYGLEVLIDSYRSESALLTRKDIVTPEEFVNKKISALAYKYVNDPLSLASGGIPDLVKDICERASYLLDFKSKYNYYKNACFHISRALYYICHTNKARLKELESTRVGKIHRKKIKVTRDKILENAVVNFETYGYKKSILDFEFYGEEGTGLGPTLEYYSMVASEMKNPEHSLWKNTASNLLYPSPIDPYDLKYPDPNKSKKKSVNQENKRDFEKFQLIFRCAGTLVARSILDERMVDLPFHSVFWDVILEKSLFLEDVMKIDPVVGETLLRLQEIVNKKHEIEKDQTLPPVEKSKKIQELTFKGSSIEDLALNFTLPGYNEIELIENGEDMPVTLSNLDQYVSILARYILVETLKSQTSAFREGFDKVIPLRHLKMFESHEIEALVCGGSRDEDWDVKTLENNFVPAHGYGANSKSFKNFIELVSSFTSEEKRIFLKFVTGAERLPYGGFKNLNPKLTIVKKQPNMQHEHPDEYLPSVMTCQNYVKLPDYSTIEVMKKKLFFAMNEGQNSFSLS